MTAPVVHVVDDDQAFRTAMTRVLKAAGYEVRGYASAGDFLVARTDGAPGCVLLDLNMPGPSGLDLQEALARQASPLPVVFVSGQGDIAASVKAIKAGAVDFLTKPVRREALLAAVRGALERAEASRASSEQLSLWRERYASLNAREAEVFKLVVAGKLNKQIAAELGVAERTVKGYRAQVMEKMQAGSVAELAQIAARLH